MGWSFSKGGAADIGMEYGWDSVTPPPLDQCNTTCCESAYSTVLQFRDSHPVLPLLTFGTMLLAVLNCIAHTYE